MLSTISVRPRRRGLVITALATFVAAVAALIVGLVPAQAATPTLSLSFSGDRWATAGSGYAQGRSDVTVWVYDITGGTAKALESRTPVTTSVTAKHCTAGKIISCVFIFGGRLSTSGTRHWVAGGGIIGPHWQTDHPVLCGHTYQAFSYDASDGTVMSAPASTPACPPPPR